MGVGAAGMFQGLRSCIENRRFRHPELAKDPVGGCPGGRVEGSVKRACRFADSKWIPRAATRDDKEGRRKQSDWISFPFPMHDSGGGVGVAQVELAAEELATTVFGEVSRVNLSREIDHALAQGFGGHAAGRQGVDVQGIRCPVAGLGGVRPEG